MKPRPMSAGEYPLGELRKSFMSQSLNKVTRTYGGGSGYSSEARAVQKKNPFIVLGDCDIKNIIKTVITTGGRRLSVGRHVPKQNAFKDYPLVTKVEYVDNRGNLMTIKKNV